MTGQLTVISGPTAVGKGTLVRALNQRCVQVWVSISVTTRAPRPTEIDGVDYCFVTDAEFDELLANDGLLEWAEIHGSTRYGTPRAPVEAAVAAGKTVILEIDVQGALQVRSSYPTARLVFIAPPTREELVERLRGRGTETNEQMERRLKTAETEMSQMDLFDDVVVNDVLEETVAVLVDLLGLQVSNDIEGVF